LIALNAGQWQPSWRAASMVPAGIHPDSPEVGTLLLARAASIRVGNAKVKASQETSSHQPIRPNGSAANKNGPQFRLIAELPI
jgi:hypothetical protein